MVLDRFESLEVPHKLSCGVDLCMTDCFANAIELFGLLKFSINFLSLVPRFLLEIQVVSRYEDHSHGYLVNLL